MFWSRRKGSWYGRAFKALLYSFFLYWCARRFQKSVSRTRSKSRTGSSGKPAQRA